MSTAIFPTLPGLEWTVRKTPEFRTKAQRATSGREARTPMWSYPIWHIGMSYEFLRDDATNELQTLMGFFLARYGGADNFNFLDPYDNAVTNHTFGIGDGVTTEFQLTKIYAGFIEPVFRVKGTPVVKVNGVTKATPADYSIDAEGLVTFATAPANTHPLTWTGEYYLRCCFEEDSADFEEFMKKLWQLRRCDIRTDK